MRAARCALALVCAYHLALVVAVAVLWPTLRDDIASAHPTFGPSQIDGALTRALIITVAVHVPLCVLTLALVRALPSGRTWALRVSTVSQAFGVGFAYASTPPFADLRPWVPVVMVVQAAVIVLLWAPESARCFFSDRHRLGSSPSPSVPHRPDAARGGRARRPGE